MKRLWGLVFVLVVMLSGCLGGGGSGYLCLGRGDGADYTYDCDGSWDGLNETETLEANLSDELGDEVELSLTVSSEAGSLEVTVYSDDEPITFIVNAGVPETVRATLGIAELRTITVEIVPLAERYRGRDRANGVALQMLIAPAENG
jgi:hypothetical protein